MSTTPVSFGGLESGLDTSEIISAEMAIYEQPLNSLKTEQTSLNTQIADYQTINSQLLSLQQAADALSAPIAYDEAFSASSSNSSVASGSITSGTSAGAVTIAVDQLATGSTQISAGTVASPVDVVATGNLLVGSGAAPLGISSLASGTGLAVGAHSISVSQASAGAGVSSSSPLPTSTTITSSNNELDVTVNGSDPERRTRERHLLQLSTGERDHPILGRHARGDRQLRRHLDGRDESARLERVAASDGRFRALDARALEWCDCLRCRR